MPTRRDLLLAFAVTIVPASLCGMQGDKQPREDQLTTVTLIIDGMT